MKISQNLSSCSDEELLSPFIPPAVARELVASYGSLQRLLVNTCPNELAKMKGIGPVKAKQLEYVCEMVKRLHRASVELPVAIKSASDVFKTMAEMQYLVQEEFRAIYLNTRNGIIGSRQISRGTINATVVGPREVFSVAVKLMACGVILVHNHPSGDPSPSEADIIITRRMAEAGKLLEINVVDHVIIAQGRYESLKERGVI
jgi:DNA repair protein RadC